MESVLLLISFIFTFAYLLTWVKFHKYQFLERDYTTVANHKEYGRLWHTWKGANQGIFFVLLGSLFGWQLGIINALIYWVLFDGLLNILVLNKEFFYVGYSSWIDKALRSTTRFINKLLSRISIKTGISPQQLSFTVKSILLAVSLYIYYI